MTPQLFDSHCHIHATEPFEGEEVTRQLWVKAGIQDPNDIITRAQDVGVNQMICIGCTVPDSRLAVSFVQDKTGCWATVGIHPHEAKDYLQEESKNALKELARQPKVVAIGECGLDFHYQHSPKEAQVSALKFQIELAHERGLPVVFHVREAFEDFWPIFESYQVKGVLHSFTDNEANLERAVKQGLLIGVNGIATFTKNAEQLDVYRKIPLGNLLLETDAPFLTPHPYRGKVCEPYHVRTIAEFLAKLRGETIEAVAEATTANARQLFNV